MSTDKFTIKTEYLTSVPVSFNHPKSVSGVTGITYAVEHPAFDAMKKHMEARGYIKVDTLCSNRDTVLKPFSVNDREYKVGDRFTCASNQGIIEDIERKKNSLT